jgi:hypothetical protein
MKPVLGVLALALLLGGGCASTPVNLAPRPKIAAFALTKDVVWRRVTAFMIAEGLPMRSIKPGAGLIYAENALAATTISDQQKQTFQAFARCGRRTAPAGGYVTGVLVYVQPAKGGVMVTVTAGFYEVSKVGLGGQFATADITAHCGTTGQLESELMSAIGGS